ncbi:hypothetical protein CA13_26570 [Planctomycetes bacterium CA13]|uniref:Uncharacterized protein n=1 Tax=Novipirellula herctigrandis TaxID=2527986 RepID=A0A5C5Z1F4_9BACT|nr:hypothetical protein CA13_26570 [Planctomycetes bacterium CA13]
MVKNEQVLVEYAKELIEARRSRGDTKLALMERFEINKTQAGLLLREATIQLYDHPSTDPIFWLAQTGGDVSPQHRRFARSKFYKLVLDSP